MYQLFELFPKLTVEGSVSPPSMQPAAIPIEEEEKGAFLPGC